MGLRTLRASLVAAGAAALSVLAVVVALGTPAAGDRVVVGVLHALLIATPVAVGLYALRREPSNQFARLLVVAGFLWAPSLLAASDGSLSYSIGRVGGWIVLLTLVALLLTFPSGHLAGRAERRLVLAAVILVAVLYLPVALLSPTFPAPSPWSACRHACPSNAFALTSSEPGFIQSVISPLREVAAVALFVATAVVLGLKLLRASRPMRRTLAPVFVAAALALLGDAAFLVARAADPWSSTTRVLGYAAVLAAPIGVAGFLIGLLRWRWVATHALRRLTDEFEHASSGARVRELLAEAVRDDSMEIAYWTGDPGRWVNDAGMPVTLPRDNPTRAVTEVEAEGRPLAALVHDAAHVDEPSVREVARGFALMALENRRLDAELRSSLHELRESRARILGAIDFERQRIERDLHDGAQQRLVALRVTAEVAAEAAEADPATGADRLRALGAEIERTLDEVRALARGVYPPLLADHGLGEALRMAARTSPLPTTLRSRGLGRYSQQIESAVYFCCLEAMQNAAKHSRATNVAVTLSEQDELRFEVRDDGRGFAQRAVRGAGLDNMRDRIASLGGKLTIESVPGQGTSVIGAVPVGLAALTPDADRLLQRATDALEDSFAIYRAARDSQGTIVDFTVEHINDAACRDLGRTREAQVGRLLGSLDRDYLGSELFAWHCQALSADGPSSLDELYYERSSAPSRLAKAYELRAVPLGGGRLAVAWREITDRKRAENELLLEATVLQRATEGVCLVRATDGVIVYANPRFAELYGYEPGDLDGSHVSVLNWEDDAGVARRQANRILADLNERGETTYEIRNRRRDGTPMWSEAHVGSFDHPVHGKVWVSVQRDVTDRRQAEDEFRAWQQGTRGTASGMPAAPPDARAHSRAARTRLR